VSPAQLILIETAVKTELIVRAAEDYILRQSELVVGGALVPVVMQRQQLADSLCRMLEQLDAGETDRRYFAGCCMRSINACCCSACTFSTVGRFCTWPHHAASFGRPSVKGFEPSIGSMRFAKKKVGARAQSPNVKALPIA
jgi:hypothetical protein